MNNIKNGDMPLKVAKKVLRGMDPNTAMKSREEFTQLLAAVAKVYPQHLDSKKGKTTLRKVLVAACAPGKSSGT